MQFVAINEGPSQIKESSPGLTSYYQQMLVSHSFGSRQTGITGSYFILPSLELICAFGHIEGSMSPMPFLQDDGIAAHGVLLVFLRMWGVIPSSTPVSGVNDADQLCFSQPKINHICPHYSPYHRTSQIISLQHWKLVSC